MNQNYSNFILRKLRAYNDMELSDTSRDEEFAPLVLQTNQISYLVDRTVTRTQSRVFEHSNQEVDKSVCNDMGASHHILWRYNYVCKC